MGPVVGDSAMVAAVDDLGAVTADGAEATGLGRGAAVSWDSELVDLDPNTAARTTTAMTATRARTFFPNPLGMRFDDEGCEAKRHPRRGVRRDPVSLPTCANAGAMQCAESPRLRQGPKDPVTLSKPGG